MYISGTAINTLVLLTFRKVYNRQGHLLTVKFKQSSFKCFHLKNIKVSCFHFYRCLVCITNMLSPFTNTCGKEWKEKNIIWERACEKANSICICGPYMSNQSDDAMGQLHLFFPPLFLLNLSHNFSTWVIFGNYFSLKACFESSLWMNP